MVGQSDKEEECGEHKKSDTEELVCRVHEATAHKESFVKVYTLKDIPLIKSTKTRSANGKKASKIDNFRQAISEFPFLFEFDFIRHGFNRLVLESDRFNQLLVQYGVECLGASNLRDFPNVFETRKALAHEVEVFIDKDLGTYHSADRHIIATQMHDDTGAGTCTEIVNNIEAVQDYIRGAQTDKTTRST